jgi:hypothetical protein
MPGPVPDKNHIYTDRTACAVLSPETAGSAGDSYCSKRAKVFARGCRYKQWERPQVAEGVSLSTSGITSSLLSQIIGSPSTADQFATDLNQLAQDLQSGSLPAAQQNYVQLSEDALNGATSSTANTSASGITTALLSNIASSPSASNTFSSELNQLGSDLQNGDLASTQQDLLAIDSTALNAASAASSGSSATPGTTSSTSAGSSESAVLIQGVIQALEAGDNSAVSSALTQLAAISPNSAGASALQQASESFASGSSSSSSSSSITQLLQSLDTSDTGNSASILSLLA